MNVEIIYKARLQVAALTQKLTPTSAARLQSITFNKGSYREKKLYHNITGLCIAIS